MADGQGRVRWPDGVSVSLPTPMGSIGGTYYWDPGAVGAPHVTLRSTYGMPRVGVNAVFLRDGMTSGDTLGLGVNGNVSTIVPSVTLNGTFPNASNHIPQPWNSRVTSIEAGMGNPGASPAVTSTYDPQQIADFIAKYILSPPSGPNAKPAFVRDSAAAAGVPSRNNVFEYGFPEPGSAQPNVFDTGAPPVPYLPSGSQGKTGGMPGMLAAVMGVDPTNPDQPPPGGLYPLMLEYMRNNPGDNSGR